MRLTRRGYAVLAVVVLAVSSGAAFGARGLNAIAMPGAVALAYAAVQVWRFESPTVERELPSRGTQGSSVTVVLDVTANPPFSARFTDTVSEGLVAEGHDRPVGTGADPTTYELQLRRRGERSVGPATIEARDVLGLVSRTYDIPGTQSVLVRPPVYPLSGARADELVWIFGGGDDRQEFDYLRHYRRGDPLRDVHWRSSAKVPGESFIVKQFGTDEGLESAVVAGESTDGHDDELAAAVASIAAHLLAAGLEVGLAVPDATLPPRHGGDQRDQLLDALAHTNGGRLREGDRRRADIVVRADDEGVTVELADGVTAFSEVAGRPVSLPTRGADGRPGGLA